MAKNTIVTSIDTSALSDPTENQWKFIKGILKGLSATKAYQQAFDCGDMGYGAVSVEASKLRNHPEISLWISACKIAHLGEGALTLDRHLDNLERLQELALANGNVSAAVMTEQIKGKAAGLHIERVQEVPLGSEDALAELAKANPALAKQLAEQAGIALDEPVKH